MLKSELTPVQQTILTFIILFNKKYGFTPTYSEIAENLRLPRSNIYYHTIRIEQKGFIKRNSMRRMRELELL